MKKPFMLPVGVQRLPVVHSVNCVCVCVGVRLCVCVYAKDGAIDVK